MIAAKLDAAIKAVCPVHGVSIGRVNDKQTWRIDFKEEEATAQQRAAAQVVLDAFDPNSGAHNEAIDGQIAAIERAQLAPRFSREGMLGLILLDYMRANQVTKGEAVANLTNPEHADYNAGFTRLKALDDSIRALRAQRR